MNKNMLIAKLQNKNKGQWFTLSWISDLPIKAMYKRDGIVVNKRTTATVRFGINYANMASVQAKVEQGYELKHDLPWGQWSPQYPGILIEHKGSEYLRVYNSPNKPRSEYFVNGKPVTIEMLRLLGYVQDSYWKRSSEKIDCFTVKVENIESIG